MFALIIFLFLIIKVLFFTKKADKQLKESYKHFKLIPCPEEIPLIGNLSDFFCDEGELWRRTRERGIQYYPIYRLKFFNLNVVAFLHPDDIEMILTSTSEITKGQMYSTLKQWLGDGLVTSTGEIWQKKRKILTKNFHFSILKEYVSIINEQSSSLVEKLRKCTPFSFDICPFIAETTLEVINEVIVGEDLKMDITMIKKYIRAINTMTKIIYLKNFKPQTRLLFPFSELKKEEVRGLHNMHEFSTNVLENRVQIKKNMRGKRMVDTLMNEESLFNVHDEIATFFFAGHDTTSSGLSFALLALANYPEHQEAIHEEIENISKDDVVTYEEVKRMCILDRFLKECLRLYPPVVFIGRELQEDMLTSTGYLIPKGTTVALHIYDIHRNPNIFPEPEKFDPDRFLPDESRCRHPFSYIPFSAGQRNCIAQKFAALEMKITICRLLKKYTLQAIDRIEDLIFVSDTILKAKGGIKVKFVERH